MSLVILLNASFLEPIVKRLFGCLTVFVLFQINFPAFSFNDEQENKAPKSFSQFIDECHRNSSFDECVYYVSKGGLALGAGSLLGGTRNLKKLFALRDNDTAFMQCLTNLSTKDVVGTTLVAGGAIALTIGMVYFCNGLIEELTYINELDED